MIDLLVEIGHSDILYDLCEKQDRFIIILN